MKCYVCGKNEDSMILRRKDSKVVNFHGALKCEVCSKSAVLSDRFYNLHTLQSYYEQSTMSTEKVVVKITASQDEVVKESDQSGDAEGRMLIKHDQY